MRASKPRATTGLSLRNLERIEEAVAEVGEPITISLAVKKGAKYMLAVWVDGQWKITNTD